MGTIILVISFLMVPHESLTEDTPGDSSSSSSSSSSDEDDDSDIGNNAEKKKKNKLERQVCAEFAEED